MEEFIGVFSAFLEVQTAIVAKFYEVIHAMKEVKKIGLTNVWLECDSTLVCNGKAPNHLQPHNKEDEDLEVVYGFICKYGSNWAFVYFCRTNQEDNSRMKECTNISKKTSNSSKHN